MRRKILMGVLAVALPAGALATTQSTAFAKVVQNPIACANFAGTVTFGTPLTTAGVATSAKLSNNTNVTGTSGTCTGSKALVATSLNIAGGKNAKLVKTDPRYNKATGVKYVEGTWAEFTASGTGFKKTLKTISFTIGGSPVLFKTKGSSEVVGGACGAAVGFQITGMVKNGTYADKTASILACLTTDAGGTSTGSFIADLLVAQGMTSAQIGGNSNATL